MTVRAPRQRPSGLTRRRQREQLLEAHRIPELDLEPDRGQALAVGAELGTVYTAGMARQLTDQPAIGDAPEENISFPVRVGQQPAIRAERESVDREPTVQSSVRKARRWSVSRKVTRWSR